MMEVIIMIMIIMGLRTDITLNNMIITTRLTICLVQKTQGANKSQVHLILVGFREIEIGKMI